MFPVVAPEVDGFDGHPGRREGGFGQGLGAADNGVLKSVVFGFTVTFVALVQGFEAQPTPEGVSRATTRTVVVASLAILGLDFILTALMFSI